jgi:hypothetical protein
MVEITDQPDTISRRVSSVSGPDMADSIAAELKSKNDKIRLVKLQLAECKDTVAYHTALMGRLQETAIHMQGSIETLTQLQEKITSSSS